ncbi:hypothetical protein AUJ67_02630 [Candidatus Desantisbacteria bacterium CG1_02_49_89]|nr:MAG: hypothetical protein AUJ67_02630 [Candidatus Desantisbacteria bacterium CG1_02_49_89]
MKKSSAVIAVIIMGMVAGGASVSYAINQNAGTTGAQFLKFRPGARQAAMGDAFSSVKGDAFSVCWNPASISGMNASVSFMHSFWLEDATVDYVACAVPLQEFATLGFTFGYLNAGAIQKLDKNGIELAGSFSPFDIAAGAAVAKNIIPGLDAGFAAKVIYSDIDGSSASSLAVDAGITYSVLQDSLRAGLSVQNLGASMKFISQQDTLPSAVRLGASYRFRSLLVSLDAVMPYDADVSLQAGAEYAVNVAGSLSCILRAGYNGTNYSAGCPGGLTLGGGIQGESFAIDYAWIPFGAVGNTHRISARMNL